MLWRFPMAETVYDFSCKTPAGDDRSLADYKGKVLLVVNVASLWGATSTWRFYQHGKQFSRWNHFEDKILQIPVKNDFKSFSPNWKLWNTIVKRFPPEFMWKTFSISFSHILIFRRFFTDTINGPFWGVERQDRHRSKGLCELFRLVVRLNCIRVEEKHKWSMRHCLVHGPWKFCFTGWKLLFHFYFTGANKNKKLSGEKQNVTFFTENNFPC